MLPLIPIVLAASAAAYGLHKIITPGKKQNLSYNFKNFLEKLGVKPDKDGIYDLDTILPDGDPILFKIAAEYDGVKLLQEFIKAGGNLHVMNKEGRTAIFYAQWWYDSFNILEEHLDVNAQDIYGRTLLFYATPDNIEYLASNGCNPMITDAKGKNILFYLSLDDKHLDESVLAAKHLIHKYPELKHQRDPEGRIPPILQVYLVKELLSLYDEDEVKLAPNHNYDINARLLDGNPILFKIVSKDIGYLLRDFIDMGGDIHVMNDKGQTAIFFTKWNYNSFEILKEHLDVNTQDIYGRTILFYTKPVDILYTISEGCNPVITDAEGKNILFYLPLDNEHLEESLFIAKNLIELYPKLQGMRDHKGELPPISQYYPQIELNNSLISALTKHDKDGIVVALQKGANPNCIEKNSPLLASYRYISIDIIELLIQYGADVNASYNGNSILHQYIYTDIDKLKLLLNHGAVVSERDLESANIPRNRENYKLLEKYYKIQQSEK